MLGDYFHLKFFALSFSALLLLVITTIGILSSSKDTSHSSTAPTGKVMSVIQIVQKHVAPEPAPLPPHEPTPTVSETLPETLNTAPLEAIDKQPETTQSASDIAPQPIEDSVAGLSEETPYGSLPIVRTTDGMKPFDAYKTPFALKPDTKAVISLVMIDFGLSDKTSKEALDKLPPFITMVASPYSSNLQAKVSAARAKGQELWVSIPTQTTNFAENDTGPSSLLASINVKQNISRLNTTLGRATGYAGVAFINAPDFPDTSLEFQSVIDAIAKRGLGITQLDTADGILKSTTQKTTAPFIQNALWIDTLLQKDAILSALSGLESSAIEKSYIVAAFRPSPLTFTLITEWQKNLSTKNIQLAPLSYAIHQDGLTKKK